MTSQTFVYSSTTGIMLMLISYSFEVLAALLCCCFFFSSSVLSLAVLYVSLCAAVYLSASV